MNSPSEIAKLYSAAGAAKTRNSVSKTFVLAIFAGAFIALGALGSSIANCGVQPAAVSRLLSALIFPVGLIMVVVAGSELFTGNCLIIISVLDKKTSTLAMIKNLVTVWIGNFVGAMIIVILCTYGHVYSLYDGQLAQSAVNTALAKVNLSFMDGFLKGILCNIMVCIAVWMTFAPKQISGKILAGYLPIIVFVLCGFEHCVANFYFIPAGILASMEYNIPCPGLNWGSFLLKNELPVTLGNIAGGSVFVGLGYWFVYLKGNKD